MDTLPSSLSVQILSFSSCKFLLNCSFGTCTFGTWVLHVDLFFQIKSYCNVQQVSIYLCNAVLPCRMCCTTDTWPLVCHSSYCIGCRSCSDTPASFGDLYPTSESSSGNPCFSSNARVSLESGKTVTMSELQVGDQVTTGTFTSVNGFFVKKEYVTS